MLELFYILLKGISTGKQPLDLKATTDGKNTKYSPQRALIQFIFLSVFNEISHFKGTYGLLFLEFS